MVRIATDNEHKTEARSSSMPVIESDTENCPDSFVRDGSADNRKVSHFDVAIPRYWDTLMALLHSEPVQPGGERSETQEFSRAPHGSQ